MTVEQIIRRLGCREFYARKMITWANGDEMELRRLVSQKEYELQSRPAIVEVK